ncbi:E3 ubiquitin-protein ligase UHRF1 [Neolecta irregularis DAH-3]|uniref:E3 ubiquitin-protein ligase UHRF1 n=1 Tax=Neolecta irregularis (strain DAH-3) TaxID=1198029 RepID=A0A1U7LMT2_NEOID|nr:E3 ubiquitin-protein ligase UHRF1 [Neolecta irregularis DAH-3]|eukprot:OLL23852.1 E3 ubiquitin-protein ligase UHRF1 [Neolecta irregularis DAH-3]
MFPDYYSSSNLNSTDLFLFGLNEEIGSNALNLTDLSHFSACDPPKVPLKTPKAKKRKSSESNLIFQTEERIAPGIIRRRVNGRLSMSFDDHIKEKKKRMGKSKVFGPIEGFPVGYWWAFRMECHRDGIHEAPVAGIVGTPQTGCPSIAISGGYEDDVDNGYEFIYTGAGGRDLKGTEETRKNLRTAPQSKDQEASSTNMALMKSCDEKLPVRVVRGFKGRKPWAPPVGFRYDGLYRVVKYYQVVGISGFKVIVVTLIKAYLKVWRFDFARLPNQPPIDIEGVYAKEHHQYELAGVVIDEQTGKLHKKASTHIRSKKGCDSIKNPATLKEKPPVISVKSEYRNGVEGNNLLDIKHEDESSKPRNSRAVGKLCKTNRVKSVLSEINVQQQIFEPIEYIVMGDARAECKERKIKRETGSSNTENSWETSCQRILDTLFCRTYANIAISFLEPVGKAFIRPSINPVDRDEYPDYYEEIQKPIDLGLVQNRLASRVYNCPQEFYDDLALMFANCHYYNMEGSDIVQDATRLEGVFKRRWAKVFGTME